MTGQEIFDWVLFKVLTVWLIGLGVGMVFSVYRRITKY